MDEPAPWLARVTRVLVALGVVWTAGCGPASPPATSAPVTPAAPSSVRAIPNADAVSAAGAQPTPETGAEAASEPGSIRFVVTTEGDDRRPVAGALIELRFPDSAPFKFTTGRDGTSSLAVPVAALQGCEAGVSAPGLTPAVTLLAIDATNTASLTLTPWPALTGRVLDGRTGKPIAGAHVTAYRDETTTDIAGDFVFRADWPDWGAIGEISAPGHVGLRYEHDPRSGPLTVWLDPGGRVSGTVRTKDGAPVADAKVFAGVDQSDSDQLGPTAMSDTHGAFVLDGLVLGAPHWLWARVKALPEGVTDGVVATQAAPDVTRDIVLGGGASLTVVVKDPADVVVPDAAVSTGRREIYEALQGRTGADGACVVAPLLPGPLRVNVWSDGFAEASVDVDVAPDEAKRIEVRLPQAVPIDGVVVDDTGAPVGGADVWFRAPRPFERWGPCGVTRPGPFRTTVTAADGSFHAVVPRSAGLEYELRAPGHVEPPERKNGFRTRIPWRRGERDPTVRFLPEVDPLRLVLARAATIRFVLRPPPGASFFGAYVKAFDEAGANVAEEDLRDASRFVAPVTARRLSIEVNGFLPVTREVRLVAGEVTDLGEIALERGAGVGGRLVDGDGRPVRGAKLSITRDGDDAVWEAGARDDGSFDVWGIPPGAVEMTVQAPAHVRTRRRVAADGRADRLLVALDAGVAVTVRVLDDAGLAALCDELSVLGADGAPSVASFGRTTPGCWAGRLPAGRWRLVAMRGDVKSEQTIDVADGEPRPFTLRLQR
jgi:hypothetical protein